MGNPPALPPRLLEAVTAPGGGKIVLVLGAGCSVPDPPRLPTAKDLSIDCHRILIENGVLSPGDCNDPSNLSTLADVVFGKTGLQRPLVDCMGRNRFENAEPNEGYLIAAALMRERAVSCTLTLNFDLAVTNAVAQVGAGPEIAIIRGPEDHSRLAALNVIFLHRSATADPEDWILRTREVEGTWQGEWREVISRRVLSSPIIVFAGLGSAASVLTETVRNIRDVIPEGIEVFQVDVVDHDRSPFFAELKLPVTSFVKMGWVEFMEVLADRLTREHLHELGLETERLARQGNHQIEEIADLKDQLREMGLLEIGRIRAKWLLEKTSYLPHYAALTELIADLILGIALIARTTNTQAIFMADGVIEFRAGNKTLAAIGVASGRGTKDWMTMEAQIQNQKADFDRHNPRLIAVMMAGVQGNAENVSAPEDILASAGDDDIIDGGDALRLLSVADLRRRPELISGMVPNG